MSNIYSRKRFIIKPKSKTRKVPAKIKSQTTKTIIILCVAIIIYNLIVSYIEPVFETLCEEKVRAVATIISNQESTKVMNKYQYEELYTIEKDENGNIVLIESNVVPINNMISDLTEGIQNRFSELKETQIDISIGNIFGTYYFSGIKPSIPAKVAMTGTLDTEIKSEFIAKGINQTLHRIYAKFECYVQIITPIENFKKKITNQVIIAEHIVVGKIPETYYNLEGMNSSDDTLNMIN